jgi:uncharacterized protein (TIGR02271 family)
MVEDLERTIDEEVAAHPLPNEFIVPGATPPSAALDLARSTVRRAERRVVEHFGISEPAAKPALVPDPPPEPEPTELMDPVDTTAEPVPEPTGEEVVLSEEQLVVETERVPAQHVRVRKEIVEEEVTVTVVLRHEELVIEREPIAPGEAPAETAGGPKLDEAPIEIVLWAEEPVVTTRAVPTERVRVLRTLGSQQQDLTAQLRRERASFDHATGDDQP